MTMHGSLKVGRMQRANIAAQENGLCKQGYRKRVQSARRAGERMSKHKDTYRVVPFPQSRKLVIDTLRLGQRRQIMHGLIEVDITHTRQAIRAYRARTGAGLSLTAFVIACLGKAIEADTSLHAYRNWRNQLVLFDEVDVTTIIETELEGQSFPLAHIIRAANRRTAQDIDREIQAVRANPENSPSMRQWQAARWFVLLPAFLRHLVYRAIFRDPHTIKRTVGTVIVTAVGMFGVGGGWGIGLPNYTLSLTLGGTSRKPGVVREQIAIRDYLSITISIDHAIVDGAPAARFARRLKQLIESADGLEDSLEDGLEDGLEDDRAEEHEKQKRRST